MFNVQIDLNETNQSDFEAIVKQEGFASISDYFNTLVKSKILAAKVATQVMEEDGVDIRDELEEAFYEVFTGKTVPLESLWEDDEA